MLEKLRWWRYNRYEARVAAAEDFAVFEQWANGPWTPEMVAIMPWDVLVRGPQFGGIDAESRRVIDLEIDRRFQSRQPLIANVIAFGALIVATIALYRTW